MPLHEEIPLCDRVFFDDEFPWVVIYLDEYSLVAANRENKHGRRLIDDSVAGRLIYSSIRVEKTSLAANLLTRSSPKSKERVLDACVAANEAMPSPTIYSLLDNMTVQGKIPMGWFFSYFESELFRLENVDHHGTRSANVLECRRQIVTTLSQRYNDLGNQRLSQKWGAYALQISAAARALAQGKREPLIDRLRPDSELQHDGGG